MHIITLFFLAVNMQLERRYIVCATESVTKGKGDEIETKLNGKRTGTEHK